MYRHDPSCTYHGGAMPYKAILIEMTFIPEHTLTALHDLAWTLHGPHTWLATQLDLSENKLPQI